MNTFTSALRRYGVLLAGASLLVGVAVPSLAKDKGKAGSLPEAGCYDVVGSPNPDNRDEAVGEVTRVKQTTTETKTRTDAGTVDLAGTPLAGTAAEQVAAVDDTEEEYTETTTTFTDEVDVRLTLGLAATACRDARYRLRITDEAGAFVTDVIVPGDGTTDTVSWSTRFAYPDVDPDPTVDRQLFMSVTTEDTSGNVADTAPDDPVGAAYNIAGGGAVSSFK